MRHLILLNLVGIVVAKTGLDTISSITVNTFTCLQKNNFTFYIGRAWSRINTYDLTGIQNIINARQAGMTDVDAYIYPCATSSCPPGADQVEATIDKLNEMGAKIGTLWMDIEGTWPDDLIANQQFIQGMVAAAKTRNVTVGIYSGQYFWPDIVGNWTGMSNYPLWWPNYNHDPGFSKYPQYGGWTKPLMHQYYGDYAQGPCGLDDIDLNYKD